MQDEIRRAGEGDVEPTEFDKRLVDLPDETPEQKIQSFTSLKQIYDFALIVKKEQLGGEVWNLLKTRALAICKEYAEILKTNPENLAAYRLELSNIGRCNLFDTADLENFARQWADAVAQKPE